MEFYSHDILAQIPTNELFHFSGATIDRIEHFSCGHIVPPENVLPLVIKTGPSNKLLDFSFQKRDQLETLSELSRVLINACNIIPGGVVVFFPSYDYESRYVHIVWKLRKFPPTHF